MSPRIRAIGVMLALAAGLAVEGAAPRLTAFERSQGWRFLFDGEDLGNWHGYAQNRIPPNWTVADGAVHVREGRPIATDEQFGDFELTFEWKAEAGGVAVVYFRVTEDFPDPGDSGPLFELAGPGTDCGGNGGFNKPWSEIRIAPDEWASGRLAVSGSQVDYWVNGTRLQSYALDGPEWREAVAASASAGRKELGRLPEGAIVLAGDRASFRNIKVRTP